jgi:putative ATP-dependent endonuclease of OLD family
MIAERIQIKNLKCFEKVDLNLQKLNALIGENSSGKSTIIKALSLAFGRSEPSLTDFRTVGEPLVVIIDFCELDENEQKVFYDVKNSKKISVCREWHFNNEDSKIEKKSYYVSEQPDDEMLRPWAARGREQKHPHRSKFARRVYGERLDSYLNIREDYMTVERPVWIEVALRFISDHFAKIKWQKSKIFLSAEQENSLPTFMLVPPTLNLDDLYYPSIDGTSIQRGFGLLVDEAANDISVQMEEFLSSTISKYNIEDKLEIKVIKEFLNRFQNISVNIKLNAKINKPSLSLDTIINDGSETSLDQKGHGIQRIILIGHLLSTLAKIDEIRNSRGKNKRYFVLAFEEVQLYLHPLFQENLLKELKLQSSKDNYQVFYTTHSSIMIDVFNLESVVAIRRKDKLSFITQVNYKEIASKIDVSNPSAKTTSQSVRQRMGELLTVTGSEWFFARSVILVEGESEKYSLPILLESVDYSIAQKGTIVLAVGGKNNIERMVYLLSSFSIPHFVIFDEDKSTKSKESKISSKKICRLLDIPECEGVYLVAEKACIFREDFENAMETICPSWIFFDQQAKLIIGSKGDSGKGLRAKLIAGMIIQEIRHDKKNHVELQKLFYLISEKLSQILLAV